MSETVLARLLDHHNWANLRLLGACEALTDAQLDAEPQAGMFGSIRQLWRHLVTSQVDYVWMLTTLDHPPEAKAGLSFAELREMLNESGQELTAAAQNPSGVLAQPRLDLTDGYTVTPWLIITQIISHAMEHREQIKSILSSLGVEPPRIDGWQYGRQTGALIPPAQG